MGRSPRARKPAPAPAPIAPASPESEDTALATDASIMEQRRKKGRQSTLIRPYAARDTATSGKTILGG